jgi:hypothetical protein
MEQVRDRADFFAHFLDKSLAVGQRISSLVETFDIAANVRQVHAQASQELTYAVVQFASQVASFFILGLKQTRREIPQAVVRRIEIRGPFPDAIFQFSLSLL